MEWTPILAGILVSANLVLSLMILRIIFDKELFKSALAAMFVRYRLIRLAILLYSMCLLLSFSSQTLFIYVGEEFFLLNTWVYNVIFAFSLMGLTCAYQAMRTKKSFG